MSARVGLIGNPVAHSLSPAMHRAAFDALGMEWRYDLLPVAPAQLASTLGAIRAEEWRGVNVTIPYKQAVMPYLDDIASTARTIGAVNTIVNTAGRLTGYNSDWLGFLAALRESGYDPTYSSALLLGAGGAARAVLTALLRYGANVTIVNRDAARAEALAREMGAHFECDIAWRALADTEGIQAALNECGLLVNGTSVGMVPHVEEDPLPAAIAIPPDTLVNDLVYNPRETRLLRRAKAAGARTLNGVGMLIHQGAAAFRLWTGIDAPVEVMRRAIE